MRKITIILTAVLVIFQVSVLAQTFDKDSPFQYVFDEKDEVHQFNYMAVNFVDTTTKAVLKTFNIVENNPFNHLDYPEIEVKDPLHKNKSYEIKNTPLQDIELPEGNLVLKQGLDTTRVVDVQGYSYYQAFIRGEFLVIKYDFGIGLRDWVAGKAHVIYIFDFEGKLLHKLSDFDTDVYEWALTENGRYFSYGYGAIWDESLQQFGDVGYKIIDLQENRIIYEEIYGNLYGEVRTSAFKNLVVVTAFSTDNLYIFIDLSKNKKYSRVFTNAELGLWKKTTKSGIIMYLNNRNSDTTQFLSFESDFKVEEL